MYLCLTPAQLGGGRLCSSYGGGYVPPTFVFCSSASVFVFPETRAGLYGRLGDIILNIKPCYASCIHHHESQMYVKKDDDTRELWMRKDKGREWDVDVDAGVSRSGGAGTGDAPTFPTPGGIFDNRIHLPSSFQNEKAGLPDTGDGNTGNKYYPGRLHENRGSLSPPRFLRTPPKKQYDLPQQVKTSL